MPSEQAARQTSFAPESPGSGPAAGKIKLAPIPGGKQVLGSWSWAIPTNSATSDAAWAFASWITAKPNDVARVEKGGAAIRKSTLADPAVLQGKFGEEYYKTVEQLKSRYSTGVCSLSTSTLVHLLANY